MKTYEEKQDAIYDALMEMDADVAIDTLLDWHGRQLLSSGFYDELVEQGYIEEEEN